MRSLTCVLLAFCILGTAFGLYGSNSKVVKLDKSNFKSLVINSNELWLVEFFGNFIFTIVVNTNNFTFY